MDMKICYRPFLIWILLTSCSNTIDLHNDGEVLAKVNTTERGGIFVYTTDSGGATIRNEITISQDKLIQKTFMNNQFIIDFAYAWTLGEVNDRGREIKCSCSSGCFYYTTSDKLLFVTDYKTEVYNYTEYDTDL